MGKPEMELTVPADLAALLMKNKKAAETFNSFSPSHRREYLQWIAEAKRKETRGKRVQQTIARLTETKPRD